MIFFFFILIKKFERVKEESLEDLQRTFVEMFGGDLGKMMENDDPAAKKRARDGGCGSTNTRSTHRRSSNVSSNGSSYHC